MSNPWVRELDRINDADGIRVGVGVDYDLVVVNGRRFTVAQIERLAQLLIRATWEAAKYEADHE